jgi:hypothetical protein
LPFAGVPRFFFDVREGVRFVPDEDGLEFPDCTAAEREAAETAASIGRDLLPKGAARCVTVEVRNEHGQRVITATVTLAVDRVDPSPRHPSHPSRADVKRGTMASRAAATLDAHAVLPPTTG